MQPTRRTDARRDGKEGRPWTMTPCSRRGARSSSGTGPGHDRKQALERGLTLLRVGLSAECVADCHRTAVEVRQLVDGSL